jgi:uncharacterized protein YndB with AHSA1/START domain
MTEPRSILIPPSTVRFERLLPGPLERVWAYLTESAKRATWLAAGEWDLRLGGRIEMHVDNARLTDDPPPPEPGTCGKKIVEGRITRFEPLRALGHTWSWNGGETEVLYELTPKGRDVLLTIHHRLLDDRGLKIGVSAGWILHTGILLDLLNGVKPRPFYSTQERLKKEYEAVI